MLLYNLQILQVNEATKKTVLLILSADHETHQGFFHIHLKLVPGNFNCCYAYGNADRKTAENRDDQPYPMSSFANVTFTSVSEPIIKSSRENIGRRVEFKNFQQFAVKKIYMHMLHLSQFSCKIDGFINGFTNQYVVCLLHQLDGFLTAVVKS